MFVSRLLLCFAVLLLLLCGTSSLPPSPGCPVSCLCHTSPLLNCSLLGLSKAPSRIPTTATALDLSHNALRSLLPLGSGRTRLRGLRELWLGSNALEGLSLCLEKGEDGTRTLEKSEKHCVSWAPDIRLLSAERNQLKRLPRGLGSVKSLQILQLCCNRISELGPADTAGCTHLRELYLQHNLINTIHPLAFKDLQKLQVLDLSYNLLIAIPMPAYLSLRNLNTLVAITGNKWRCDCNLKLLRRWLSFDRELSNSTWEVVCSSPHNHAGKDLLYLEESELVCPSQVYNTPGLYKEETVEEGMELLLSCDVASQDFMLYRWWTPHGLVSESQQILLRNITEMQAGLYVCISGLLGERVSVMNVRVRKRYHDMRPQRDVNSVWDKLNGRENLNMQNNIQTASIQVSQSEFVLAVCLSVFITFIVAFFLGVLLRPFLDKLYKRIQSKRESISPPTSRSSSTGPRPYVNEGYSDNDDQMHKVRVGSRVTFGGVTEVKDEVGNVPYYVTVDDAKSDSSSDSRIDFHSSYDNTQKTESLIDDVGAHCVEVDNLRGRADQKPSIIEETHKQIPLKDKNKKTSSVAITAEVEEFELIPDPDNTIDLEEKSVSSTSSYEMKEPIEQSVDSPTLTLHYDEKALTENDTPLPGFSARLLESPKEENVDKMDPDLWNDSGESFSFSDGSPRSSSRLSQLPVLGYPLNKKELSVDKQSDSQSSCNTSESGESEGGQTEYTVNPEEESEAHYTPVSVNDDFQLGENRHTTHQEGTLTEQLHTTMGTCFRQDTITLEPSDIHIVFTQGDSFDDGPFMDHRECSDFSNINCDNEEEPIEYHVHPVYRTSQTKNSLLLDISNTDSASEDEAQCSDYPRRLEISELQSSSDHSIPVTMPDRVLNINFDNSSSSTDIEKTGKEDGERKTFKGLNKLSSLFNRSRAETDKTDQPLSKTTNTDSRRFLGLTFNTQTVASEDTVKPIGVKTIGEESFFGKIGQAFDQKLPKLNRSLLFSISDPQPPPQYASTPVIESEIESQRSSVEQVIIHDVLTKTESNDRSPSPEDDVNTSTIKGSFFEEIGACLDTIPKIKKYLQFTQIEPESSVQAPSTSLNTENIKPELVTRPQSWKSDSSFAEELSPTSKGDSVFGQTGTPFEVPKVKRYIQFTQSEPEPSVQDPSASLHAERTTPELLTKPQSWRPDLSSAEEFSPTTKGDSFFGQIGTSPEELPKVKRYIQFTQIEPESSVQASSTLLNTENIKPELVTRPQSWRSNSSSAKELSPTSKGDSVFGQTGTPFEVPKVKRYIHFTQSEPEPSVQDPSASLHAERTTPELLTKPQSWRPDLSSAEEFSPTTKGDSFFGQIGTSPEELPKVKRYIQFTQTEPESSVQAPSTSLHTENIKPELVTRPQSWRSDSLSAEELSPTSKGDSVFGQTGTPFEVPKVKRYIHFTQTEPEPSVQDPSASLHAERTTPELLTKPQSWRPDLSSAEEFSPTTKGDSFFGQIGTSPEELPKVKRYIQFTQTEPESSVQAPSTSLHTENIKPELVTRPQSWRSDSLSAEELSPTSKGDSVFGQTGTPFEVPKVKRYIQFTQTEPESSVQASSTLLNTENIKPELVTRPQSWRSDSSSAEELSPTSKGDSVFGQTGTPFEVPKVKRYIHFTQTEPEPSVQDPSASLHAERTTPELLTKPQSWRPDLSSAEEFSPTTKGDSFFGQIGTSPEELPKVKRYIQFTQIEPESSVQASSTLLNTENIKPELVTRPQSWRSNSSSAKELSPTSKGDSVFGQTGTPFEVPKVKRYIHFTQSEPEPSVQDPSASLHAERTTPELLTKPQSWRPDLSSAEEFSPTAKGDSLFGQIGTSLEELPKVKKYIQFTQTEPESFQAPSTSLNTENIKPELVTRPQSWKSDSSFAEELSPTIKGDSVFGQTGTPFEVPKVKRYIQFTQTEPESSVQAPSTSLNTNIKGEYLDGQTNTSFEKLPKVKRFVQFTQYELDFPNQSQCQSSDKQVVTPEIMTKKECTTLESSYDNYADSSRNLLEGVCASIDTVPKVKRSLHFSQSESQSSNQSLSPSLSTERVTVNALTEFYPTSQPSTINIQQVPITEFPPRSSRSLEDIKQASGVNKVFESTGSLIEISKLKRSLKFTHPQVSVQSSLLTSQTEMLTPELLSKSESNKFEWATMNKGTDSRTSEEHFKIIETNPASKPRRHLSAGIPFQDVSEETPETPRVSSDNAKEYLRHSSEARQRQERRRLMFQQKRRAMDGFGLTSPSSMSGNDDKQGNLSVHYEGTVPYHSEHAYPGASTGSTSHTSSHTNAEILGFEGRSAKSISSLRCKSSLHYRNDKYHSDV